jgi:hypothetical protein
MVLLLWFVFGLLHTAGSARLLRGFFALQFPPFLYGYVEYPFALSASTARMAVLVEVDFSLQLVEFRVRHSSTASAFRV